MKYIYSTLFFLIVAISNIFSQVKQPVFHAKSDITISVDEYHKRSHFLDEFFSNKNQISVLFPTFYNVLVDKRSKYTNSTISFERAYSLAFKQELRKIKDVALSSNDMSDDALKQLFHELYENTLSVLFDSVAIQTLNNRDVLLMTKYNENTGYSNRVMQTCTNVDFADGTTNGWQCSWGTGVGNQVSTVVGYTTQPSYFCNPGTGTYYANNIFISANQCCTGSVLGIPNGCTNASSTLAVVPVTAIVNNPAVTASANSGPINSAANSGGAGVHTIMTGGTDPNCPIPVVPPTGGNSIRLGNSNINLYKAQRLRQTFTVAAGNPNFVYQYAVVIQDPGSGHTISDQPYFKIRMYDQSNNLINCATYDVDAISAPGIGGFQSSGTVLYKNWSTVTVPLLSYVGQNVTIEFTTSDCALGGHYGYAYIQCLCTPIPITSSLPVVCNGQTTTLTAPPGAATYSWTGPGIISGASTQTAVVNVGGSYTVNMTTFYTPPQVPCQYSQSIAIGAAPSPAASNFSYTPACLGTPNTFTNNSTGGGIFQYVWNFGDGSSTLTTTTATNPIHTYTAAGNYTVSLVADNGCPQPFSLPITILSTPTASFSSSNACLNISTNFTSTAVPAASITIHSWDYGDGSAIDHGINTTHTYTNSGTYNVTYSVTNAGGCTDTYSNTVTISPNPVVSISSNTVCLGSTTIFNNTSNVAAPDNINTWAWDFDNNGTSDNNTQSPSNTYTAAGNYSVELVVTTSNGCKDSLTIPVVVNALPTATFTPSNACLNTNIALNNTSSPAANISFYTWNFGSGALPSTATTANPNLVYTTSGVKTISLNITANTTCTATITKTVEVLPSPVANFSATSVCQSTATAYTDLSTSTGSISSWQWDFTNNGSVDNTTNSPSNTFPSSGTFTTSLIVISNGCSDTVTIPVNVWGHTIPNFTPDKVCFGTSSVFTNLTDETTNANVGSGTTYSWNFADGSANSSAISPSHTYTLGGNVNASYNVTLTATSTHSCVDNVVKSVNVYAVPTASFTADSVCFGSQSHLTDVSNGNGNTVNSYAWDFSSNGTVDVTGVANPNFTFPTIGSNLVTYTASTSPVVGLVCSNITNSLTVWVNPNPVPDFTFVNSCINAQPNTFNGSASSIAVGTNTAFVWAYGDGAVSTPTLISSSSHTYATAGTFNTTLTVTSNKGCVANVVKQVVVYQKPFMSITNSSACDQSAMTFSAVAQSNSGTVTKWFWDFNNSIATIEANTQNTGFTFSGPGAHSVALVSETINGCRDTIRKPIYVNYVPVALFDVNDRDGCPTHCVRFTDQTLPITLPAQINQWQWTLGDGSVVTNTNNAAVNHCYDNNSSNQIALYDVKLVVTTDSGCVSLPNNKIGYIIVYPTPIANYEANPNPGSILTPLTYFTNLSQDYTKWWWSFGDGPFKSDSVNVNPTHFYSEVSANTYYTNLIVMNQYGCRDTAYVAVEIKPEFTFYIPNAFSPSNDDGINDYFTGVGIGIAEYEMWIFDRWGEKIFYTDDIAKGWDGRVQGKSTEGKQEVYVWKVKLKDVLGKKHEYIGHVTLLK